ncbi:restriction endonuclease subunit S [Vibrio sp. IRLE0018]|uniref:restriction endonuclease subunit S n=1 Tax=Vibrio floridensis TaxID=2908007 RepID=UPI001F008642|nr:restriction endonuclease subunit S [Vibrio floridensis]MCF8778179.1 restriction endonuclease subunit S [Vibrio floridensis]
MSVDKLRGSKHINLIAPSDIGLLMSAQSYRPEITQAIRKIKSLNWRPLRDLVINTISPGPHPKYGGGYPCLKTKNVDGLLATHEPADYADASVFKDLSKVTVKKGDLLINLTGAGSIGRVSVYYGDDKPITNQHIARMSVKATADEGYLACFLRSWWGERALEQGVAGSTGQINMVNEHVRSIPVYLPDTLAQKYIGDKVRQAEQLRAWAKRLDSFIDDRFSFLVQDLPSPKKHFSVKPEDLVPYRINPKQYDPIVTGAISKAEKSGVLLERLEGLIDARGIAGGATPKGAEYKTSGVLFCRVQNVKKLALDLSDAVYITKDDDESLKRSRCESYDVVLTITGYPGTASLVIEEDLPVNLNQHSVRFGCAESIKPGYLCAAVNSSFVKLQVERASIGGTRDALDYPSVANLLIPRLHASLEDAIDRAAISYVRAIKASKKLTDSAKTLVEALIEGQLSERQLIQAQQALDDGDNSLDQAILSKLSNAGYAIDGATPLFSDIDELYRLLESAAQAEIEG